MKYQRHNNTSSLFLLELILAVLFFSVASALCIQIFTKAHLMSQDARDLNFAVNEVSSMAEQMPDDSLQDAAAYYDSSYASCEKADAVYVLTVHYEPEDTLLKAHISMDTVADNRNIYTLDITKHRQRRAES
ncbi:hypothetical protein DW747_11305 [Coprococcus catus]|uniref:Type II secretion system protein n=1 Tax=Coprococcus catus TaxID=116085 RepID=A0A3E2XK22_9FIRM|nr:hypothetical protein [Coprococcus catus]MBD9001925.1 hypothetical protein [Coprococcus catus]RGC45444.1 hypothetical protein DW747_11305 [Coprococcus catus]